MAVGSCVTLAMKMRNSRANAVKFLTGEDLCHRPGLPGAPHARWNGGGVQGVGNGPDRLSLGL